jgi:hypothetical protein
LKKRAAAGPKGDESGTEEDFSSFFSNNRAIRSLSAAFGIEKIFGFEFVENFENERIWTDRQRTHRIKWTQIAIFLSNLRKINVLNKILGKREYNWTRK